MTIGALTSPACDTMPVTARRAVESHRRQGVGTQTGSTRSCTTALPQEKWLRVHEARRKTSRGTEAGSVRTAVRQHAGRPPPPAPARP